MNRLIASLSVGFVALSMLSGCGSGTPPTPAPTAAEAQPEVVAPTLNPTDAPVDTLVKPTVIEPAAARPAIAKSDPLKDVVPPGPLVPYLNPLTAAEINDGWISLFDGHSLFGWESSDPGVNWSVADGAITADGGPIGLLLTYTPFADYQFRCDFKMAAGGNSGVFLRTLANPKSIETDCYEINIVEEHPAGFLTGSIVGFQKTAEPISGSGDWHTFLMTANGTKLTVSLDGKEVATYDDTRPGARRSGLIGLQKNAGKIEFKNIALQPLNQKPLFNGTDLAGWHVVPSSKGEFTVEDGTIHVKGGEGFLESGSQHKDFVLQAHARTNGDAVNTGIFFRAEPGTEKARSNGYEMQIDNTSTEPEAPAPGATPSASDLPKNAGTGAIFRRINARRVITQDKDWATVTLVAFGPRVSTYVNGYAMVHWEDTRKPDPNPRKGQRLEAGHLSLQGHDPGTDASFRAITVGDLP